MADLDQLKRALINADRAGDVEGARVLAGELRKRMAAPQATDTGMSGYAQQRIDTAFEAAATDPNLALGEDVIKRGILWPVGKNKLTGEKGLAVPEIIMAPPRAMYNLGRKAMQGGLTDEAGRPTRETIEEAVEAVSIVPTTSFVRNAARQIPQAIRTAQSNVDEASRYGISLSRGQASRDFKTQAFEEDALTGGRGASAQAAMQAQRDAQRGQVDTAMQGVMDRVSPSRIGDPYEAGDQIAATLQDRAQTLREASGEAYRAAEGANAFLDPSAVTDLATRLRSTLDGAGALEGQFVAREYPTAGRALTRVEEMLSKAPKDGNVVGVGWQNIERVRRMVAESKGSTPDEGRVLGEMRRSIDKWLEDGVHSALVSGDPKFLDDLQQGRNLWRQYKEIVGNPSAIIRKMADGSANSEQIANWLYGATKVGGRSDSSNVVREIKRLIGPDAAPIEDLKRGTMMRLFNDRKGDAKTYGRLASDIMEFTSNTGRELARELYGEKGVAELKRFAAVLRTLVPDEKATNPSRSGQTIARRLSEAMNQVAPFIGYTAAGIGGALAGFGFGAAAKGAAGRKARRLASTPVPELPGLPAPRDSYVQSLRGLIQSGDSNSGQMQLMDDLRKRGMLVY